MSNKVYLRGILLHYFIQNKYGTKAHIIPVDIYGIYRIRHAETGFNASKIIILNFGSGAPKQFEDKELEDASRTWTNIAS